MFSSVMGVWLLVVVVIVVVIMMAVALVTPAPMRRDQDPTRVGSADAILRSRLAAGEISETEYRERSAVLHMHRRPRPSSPAWPVVALVIAGALVLGLIVGVATNRVGGWQAPMGGPMHGAAHMQGMMGSGTTGDGRAPAVLPDATELAIEAGDLWFDPPTIDVTAGEPVNLTVVNRGRLFHDLVIDDLGFRLDVDAGETATGGLRADRAGTFDYYCSVPGHAAAGMRGTLTVRGPAP